MRYLVALLLILGLPAFSFAAEPAPANPKPAANTEVATEVAVPSLLGVWYGEYLTDRPSGKVKAEMWMEVSYQLSVAGYEVRGHNRWNVLQDKDAKLAGPASKGSSAQYFDTFHGQIAKDGKRVSFVEDQRKSTMAAELLDADTLQVVFTEQGATTPAFTTRLKRIDTHYSPSDINVLGIDVSHHSGAVDWQRVKQAGYQFAYVKATEGIDNPDAMFETHWQGLQAANMPRGAYHFFVSEDDPEQQARFFSSRLKQDPGTLPPVVDIEVLGAHTNGDLSATLLRFLEVLQQELGVTPMIYTTPKFWDKHYRPEFAKYPLWLGEYGVIMPKVPFGWHNWSFWQYAGDKAVDGVEKTADISMIHPGLELTGFPSKTNLLNPDLE